MGTTDRCAWELFQYGREYASSRHEMHRSFPTWSRSSTGDFSVSEDCFLVPRMDAVILLRGRPAPHWMERVKERARIVVDGWHSGLIEWPTVRWTMLGRKAQKWLSWAQAAEKVPRPRPHKTLAHTNPPRSPDKLSTLALAHSQRNSKGTTQLQISYHTASPMAPTETIKHEIVCEDGNHFLHVYLPAGIEAK